MGDDTKERSRIIKKHIQESIKSIEEGGNYFFSRAKEHEREGRDSSANRCYDSAVRAYDNLANDTEVSEEKRAYYNKMSSICKEKKDISWHKKFAAFPDDNFISPYRSHVEYFSKLEKYEHEKKSNPNLKPPEDTRDMDVDRWTREDILKEIDAEMKKSKKTKR